ncbi:MAG: hypothetical protein JXB04_01200 [Kiritimatiellae bacterium]|nr:hypothetical protein [Kiritimatiellia bacterium]
MRRTCPDILVLSALCGLLSCGARAANLLLNYGFEDPYGVAGAASNWWYEAACGRETWAARWPSAWGHSFYPAGNAAGAFGQDVPVALQAGEVFIFAISAKAEGNYTNVNTTMTMAFCAGATTNGVVSRNIYDELDAGRGDWVYLELVHTNSDPGIDRLSVRCDFADCTIPGGTAWATCQFDDARLFQTRAAQTTPPNYARYEPVRGAYLGVLLERGGSSNDVAEFVQKAGKRPAVFAKFLLFKQDPFPWDWINMIKSECPGAGVHLILEPMVDFEDFFAPDWGPGQETYDAALDFITNCAAADVPVFLRFAHEANGDWYPWHPEFSTRYNIPDAVSNETYIAAFRNFADLAHSNAPNVAVVWAPNQGNGPYPMPFYEDTYPGDAYADWVGLSVYNGWSYGNSNEVLDFQFRNAIQKGYWQENDNYYDDCFEDFYWAFSDPDNPNGHKKPMMIAETAAAFEPKYAVSNEVLIAGFESLDGPAFTSSNLLCQFQSLNSDGWESSNQTWVAGFEDVSVWTWGPWGTNGHWWSNTTDAVEGSGALLMGGSPEGGGVYIGGNGRDVGSVPFATAKTIAEFQDLNSAAAGDQDWWPGGAVCSPWLDGSDMNGGTHTWTLVTDTFQGYPTNALRMSGTDRNTNSYIGGNGFSTRTADRDWGSGTHLALLLRRDGSAGLPHPMLRVELTDGARTAAVTHVAASGTYAWCLVAKADMEVDAGFAWTNIVDAKFHMLTTTAGEDPADLLIKQFRLATVANETPTDWSAYNGMEITVKRAGDTNACPLLSVVVRSDAGGVEGTAAVQRVVTGTEYYTLRIPFSEMTLSAAFTWTNVSALVLEMLTETSNATPSALYVDNWEIVNLWPAAYVDQDWWPPGTNDAYWSDETDSNGGWHAWALVDDPEDGYPDLAARLSGFDANTNYYIGGNGCSLAPEDQDWSAVTYMSLLARRGDITNAEPLLSVSLRDASNVRTARVSVVVVPTNYLEVLVPFADMEVDSGFDWARISAVVFEMLSGTPGQQPSDVYLKEFRVGTASNIWEQDWWMAGSGYQPWGDAAWAQTTDAAAGSFALQISGLITNSSQWYIGGNGCSLAVPQQDWSASGGVVLYAKQGMETNKVQPKFKLTLDNDYAETNGNEAVVESKVANTNWYEMIIAFEDFISDPGFAWTNVRMVKIELFTGEGGKQPNDLFLDHLRRASVTLTNGEDNLKWKRDWCDQLFALEDFQDGDPADPDANPDYADVSRNFRNLHMINWFHVKKFEDGFTKDLRIAEDGAGGVYSSYYERVQYDYFLTNIVIDTDGDGMPDDWEYFHFNNITNADPSADDDYDLMSNWEEFIAACNPASDTSVLVMMGGSGTNAPAGAGYVINWLSETGAVYAIDRSTNLVEGFVGLAHNIAATPPENTYLDAPVGPGIHCYRIRAVP